MITKMSTEDKQVLLLRRRWEAIEVAKDYRFRTPIVVCGLLLTVTGFVMQSNTVPSTTLHKNAILAVLITMTTVGVMIFYSVHELYNQFFEQIDYLYKQLGISGEEYFTTTHRNESKPIKLFLAGYIAIIMVGIVCSAVVSMESLKSPIGKKDNIQITFGEQSNDRKPKDMPIKIEKIPR